MRLSYIFVCARITEQNGSHILGPELNEKKKIKWKEEKRINSGLNDDVQKIKQSIIVPLHRSFVYFDWLSAEKRENKFLIGSWENE